MPSTGRPPSQKRRVAAGAVALAPTVPEIGTPTDEVYTELGILHTGVPETSTDELLLGEAEIQEDALDDATAREDDGTPPVAQTAPDPNDPAYESWLLVQRAQAGETDAQAQFYQKYFDTVFKYIYFRVGRREVAEDLAADTFYRALKRISTFTWQGRDPGAWLMTIAHRTVIDHFKSGRSRLEVLTGDVLDAKETSISREGNPEEATLSKITNAGLRAAIEQLKSEQQRRCIVLRFLQDLSVAETAAEMGLTEGATKALQSRAVRTLGRLVERTGISPSFT